MWFKTFSILFVEIIDTLIICCFLIKMNPFFIFFFYVACFKLHVLKITSVQNSNLKNIHMFLNRFGKKKGKKANNKHIGNGFKLLLIVDLAMIMK